MSERDDIINKRSAESMADVMINGPRLWSRRETYIVAKDPEKHRVLVGGLGCMGVGEMWMGDEGHRDDPTYAEAPIQVAPEGRW